jgi:hypothetical protein
MEPEGSLPHSQEPASYRYITLVKLYAKSTFHNPVYRHV